MAYPVKLLSKGLAIGIIFIIVAGFTYLKTQDFLEGPRIEISSPVNGTTVTDSLLEIEGQARHISFLYLNDSKIFVDEEGNFNESLLLYPGYNIITLRASDQFEREITKQLEIIFNAPEEKIPPPQEDAEEATSTPEELPNL